MKTLRIKRNIPQSPHATTSTIMGDGLRALNGLEPPWRDNLPFKSCVPAGIYTMLPFDSPSHGAVYIFVGGTVVMFEDQLPLSLHAVRYLVEMHGANYPHEIVGCVAPGMEVGTQDNMPAVWNSQKALSQIKDWGNYPDPLQCIISWT